MQVRHHKFGPSHPETISYAEQLALACAAIAVLHVALPDGRLHEARLALELINNTLDEYELSTDAARQLRMLALEVHAFVRASVFFKIIFLLCVGVPHCLCTRGVSLWV